MSSDNYASFADGRLRRLEEEEEEEEDDEDEVEEKGTYERESRVAFDLLKRERTIFISETVTPKLTHRVTTQLLWLDSMSDSPIKVYINTPGGSADDGFALHDALRFVKAPVFNISFGLNASAGILILLGTPRERRVAMPNARLMMHQPSGGGRGTASDIEITAIEIVRLRGRANELIARETGKTVEEVEKVTSRDYWLTAPEAQEFGLVSRIITSLRDIM